MICYSVLFFLVCLVYRAFTTRRIRGLAEKTTCRCCYHQNRKITTKPGLVLASLAHSQVAINILLLSNETVAVFETATVVNRINRQKRWSYNSEITVGIALFRVYCCGL